MPRGVFRLEPAAHPDDQNWDRAPNHGTVVVRADSPADARIVASEAEADFLERPTKPGDGVSTRFASAFRDDKLYAVFEDTSGEWPAEGERGVLSGLSDPLVVRSGDEG
jgi:hypothetical protein